MTYVIRGGKVNPAHLLTSLRHLTVKDGGGYPGERAKWDLSVKSPPEPARGEPGPREIGSLPALEAPELKFRLHFPIHCLLCFCTLCCCFCCCLFVFCCCCCFLFCFALCLSVLRRSYLHFPTTFNQYQCPKLEYDYLYGGFTVTLAKISPYGEF